MFPYTYNITNERDCTLKECKLHSNHIGLTIKIHTSQLHFSTTETKECLLNISSFERIITFEIKYCRGDKLLVLFHVEP